MHLYRIFADAYLRLGSGDGSSNENTVWMTFIELQYIEYHEAKWKLCILYHWLAMVLSKTCWINLTGPIFHLQFSDFPDPMLYSDYLPELSRHVSCSGPAHPELGADQVSWEDLLDMDLPSFRPAFLVLCRVLLNVIHECLKLRLEQRPAGEPSLLSIKQASSCWNTHFSVRI